MATRAAAQAPTPLAWSADETPMAWSEASPPAADAKKRAKKPAKKPEPKRPRQPWTEAWSAATVILLGLVVTAVIIGIVGWVVFHHRDDPPADNAPTSQEVPPTMHITAPPLISTAPADDRKAGR